MTACPEEVGWTASRYGCHRITHETASHFACDDLCGPNASLACVANAEENELLGKMVMEWAKATYNGGDASVWLGHFQPVGAREPDGGWAGCTSTVAAASSSSMLSALPNSTFWAAGQPNNLAGDHCAAMIAGSRMQWPAGRWVDSNCGWSSDLDFGLIHCLCEHKGSPSSTSPDYLAFEDAYQANLRTWTTFMFLVYFPLVSLLPFLVQRARGWAKMHLPIHPSTQPNFRTESRPTFQGSETASRAHKQLAKAECDAARLRSRVSGTIGQIGWTLLVLGSVTLLPDALDLVDLTPTAGASTYYATAVVWGFAILPLALRPTDSARIAMVCHSLCGFYVFLSGFWVYVGRSHVLGSDAVSTSIFFSLAGLFALCAVSLVPTVLSCRPNRCFLTSMEPRAMLLQLWLTQRCMLFGLGCAFLALPLGRAVRDGTWSTFLQDNEQGSRGLLVTAALTFLAAFIFTPETRGSVHYSISAMGKSDSREQEAAAVASLLGTMQVVDALTTASRLFRGLPIQTLMREDLHVSVHQHSLKQRTPESLPLSERVIQPQLGEVEAFVCHARGDKADLKFEALDTWRTMQPATGGESEPLLIWIDLACIDVGNVPTYLACLPIFLSGCRQLLVLAGPTLPTRLWCIIEIFMFCKMGGARERIDVRLLEESARGGLELLNVRQARCLLPEDRQRLLAVIETSFGTTTRFQQLVRGIIREGSAPVLRPPRHI